MPQPRQPPSPEDDQPVAQLRGATVSVDARHVGNICVALLMAVAIAVSVALFVAGAHKNAQLNALHGRGVDTEMTVVRCNGLLGGSGSNAAGYSCIGELTLAGHTYSENVPDDVLRQPGDKVAVVAVAGNPPLVNTKQALAHDQASAEVFIAPVLLALAGAVAGLFLMTRRPRRRRSASPFLLGLRGRTSPL